MLWYGKGVVIAETTAKQPQQVCSQRRRPSNNQPSVRSIIQSLAAEPGVVGAPASSPIRTARLPHTQNGQVLTQLRQASPLLPSPETRRVLTQQHQGPTLPLSPRTAYRKEKPALVGL